MKSNADVGGEPGTANLRAVYLDNEGRVLPAWIENRP